MRSPAEPRPWRPLDFDAVVVGAGFSGLYMLHRLRELGLAARVFERGSDVGGTWFWNRYPGARCDVESIDYAYSFSPDLLAEWVWTERYASQPEILRYLNYVADRFDLRRDITFNTPVDAISYDAAANAWIVTTARAETFTARYCIMAVGNLSSVKRPDVAGLDDFQGDWYHTAEWPHEGVDFSGKRVAVVGTGSTGIQAIPQIAAQAARVYVFQRTPNYSMPAWNGPLDPAELQEAVASYAVRRRLSEQSDSGVPLLPAQKATFDVPERERLRAFEDGWRRGGISALSGAFTDFTTSEAANAAAQDFARSKIREIVRDASIADALCPQHHIGTKRTCVDTGYFETYNRENVELLDLRTSPIVSITAGGITTTDRSYDVDVIVFAIGFDAITGGLLEIGIRGRGGLTLRDAWADGPRTLLGVAVAGFPNLFLITGPGSPSVLSNMVVSIEQHVDWIGGLLAYIGEHGLDRVEADAAAEEAWVRHVGELADATLYPQARSWYVGANIPGKPRVFMPYVGGCGRYRRECDEVAARGYEGFTLDRSGSAAPATTRDHGVRR